MTTPTPALRASDADRHATVALFQDAMARGQLTPDEGSERMAAAHAASGRPYCTGSSPRACGETTRDDGPPGDAGRMPIPLPPAASGGAR